MIYGPAYDGSDEYKLKVVPTISVDYEDGLFFAGIGGIGSYPIQGENYKLGASIGRSFGREESKDRKNLRGMGDIDSSTTISLMGEYGFGPVDISGKLTKGNSDYGTTATMEIGTRFPITNDLMLMTSAGLTWADDDHMNSYFGVSSVQAARSSYRRYQAESGIKSVGVNAGAFYALTKEVDMALMLSADKLLGDAADSPITHKDFQPSLFLMTSYKF
ncbi:MAG: MltA-interacting MipA family protein [Methylotenera sp.]|nr:MAG: MltA-interacting MipA family protein [Methylotenera sp.]